MLNLKGKLYNLIDFFYSKNIYLLYKHDKFVDINAPVVIKRVTFDNVQDSSTFNNEKYINTFIQFLRQGDIGYYAYLNDYCVHRSWVKTGPFKMEIVKGYNMEFDKQDAYIHYCLTADTARGKNIYPFVLDHICNELYSKNYRNIYMVVLKKKKSAMRGVEKAGFKIHKKITIFRIFGFYFKKELLIR